LRVTSRGLGDVYKRQALYLESIGSEGGYTETHLNSEISEAHEMGNRD
jgi:hypothetical protein